MREVPFVLILLSILISFPTWTQGGNEMGNGGNAVSVGGAELDFADLHFKRLAHQRYELDDALSEEIRRLLRPLSTRFHLPLVNRANENFLNDYVFSNLVQYRFVDKLPPCKFMALENLPLLKHAEDKKVFDVGCTQGKLTWIVPQYFKKFDLTRMALFIIHERLHDFVDDEAIDFKADFIKALYFLNQKYIPAFYQADKRSTTFRFDDEELRVLNSLAANVRILTGRVSRRDLMGDVLFTQEGGLLLTHQVPGDFPSSWTIVGNQVKLSLGSLIEEVEDPRITPAELQNLENYSSNIIAGMGFELRNVKLKFHGKAIIRGVYSTLSNVEIFQSDGLLDSPDLSFNKVVMESVSFELSSSNAKYEFGELRKEGPLSLYRESFRLRARDPGRDILKISDRKSWDAHFTAITSP